ncbi:hypothetical protein AtNW77_Chr4g0300931 [Arabidopsis thaliana]
MSFLVGFAMFANATVWTVISLLPVDRIMFVSFVLCTVLGLVQLVAYAVYYRSTQMFDELGIQLWLCVCFWF